MANVKLVGGTFMGGYQYDVDGVVVTVQPYGSWCMVKGPFHEKMVEMGLFFRLFSPRSWFRGEAHYLRRKIMECARPDMKQVATIVAAKSAGDTRG